MTPSQQYAEIMKQAFFQILKKRVLGYIFSKVPLFGVGIFNPIISFFVSKLLIVAAQDAKLLVYFMYIDMRVGQQGDAYEKAAIDYHNALQKGDENEIKKYEAILDKKFDDFARWNNI